MIGKFSLESDPLITEDRSHWTELRAFDPLLFWKLKPNVKVRVIETNSLGLRDKEISQEKNDEFRIISLGESTTFGTWVNQDQTYSAVLQELLKDVGGRPFRVINAGIPGYSLLQGYFYLERRGIDLNPDAVMVYFGYNDFLLVGFLGKRDGMSTGKTQGLNDWELFKQRQTLSWKISYWLAQRSNLVRAVLSSLHKKVQPESIKANPHKQRVPRKHREMLLKMFQNYCEERDIEFIIVVPWYQAFKKHIALLRKFAEQNNVSIVDLPKAIQIPPKQKKKYFVDTIHPNRKGHRLIAEAIAEELRHLWRDRN